MNNSKRRLRTLLLALCVLFGVGNFSCNYKYADSQKNTATSKTKFVLGDFFYWNNNRVKLENLPLEQWSKQDLAIKNIENKPKILIFHSHSQEAYANSKKDDPSMSVVGVGREVQRQLEERYDISVLHCEKEFDVVDGELHREKSYDRVEPVIKTILKENPSIEVLIDIHRDGVVSDINPSIMINDKPTSKIVFVNGISKEIIDDKSVDTKNSLCGRIVVV